MERTCASGRHGRAALFLCALALLVAATTSPPALAAARQAHATKIGAAPAGEQLALVLPLKGDLAGLQRLARAITDRSSPQYGQYESVSRLAERFGAPAGERTRVLRFLRANGATGVKIDATGLFADATMTVGVAQRVFGTRLNRFRTASAAQYVSPSAQARVPAAVAGAVTGVVGLDTKPLADGSAPALRKNAHTSSANPIRSGTPAGCAPALASGGFTPNQYLTAYGFQPLRAAGLLGQNERVALIEIDGFHASDVRTFASCFGLTVPRINTFGVGIKKALKPGPESTLDLEVLDAVAPRLKAIDVYESGSTSTDVVHSLAAPLQNPGSKPQVISASLSVCEPALFVSLSAPGIEAAEGSLELAAASGISILSASGDSGSSACIGPDGPIAAPDINYPASSWWVTAVGGTNAVLNPGNQLVSQVTWNDAPNALGAGGGGLSQIFRRPSYQKSFVPQNVRGVPDVSMLADVAPGYAIFCTVSPDCVDSKHPNPWLPVGGTSAGTPLLAGGLAILDQDLRTHGLQDLGLANPLLYKVDRTAIGPAVVLRCHPGRQRSRPVPPLGEHAPAGLLHGGPGLRPRDRPGHRQPRRVRRVRAQAPAEDRQRRAQAPAQPARSEQRPDAGHRLLLRSLPDGLVRDRQSGQEELRGAFQRVLPARQEPQDDFAPVLEEASRRSLHATGGGRATVFGVILDAGGNIEKQTRGQKLRIMTLGVGRGQTGPPRGGPPATGAPPPPAAARHRPPRPSPECRARDVTMSGWRCRRPRAPGEPAPPGEPLRRGLSRVII